jgi:hypothetical protein
MKTLPIDLVNELLKYDNTTGKLYWRTRNRERFKDERSFRTWNARFADKEALGSLQTRGYLHGAILCVNYTAHRVAYALHWGHWPTGEIDHINGDRTDNRPENLRCVAHEENAKNLALSRRNRSGTIGVNWDAPRKKWAAYIKHEKKSIALGRYDNIDDAIAARKAAEAQFGFHVNHGRAAAGRV